MKKRLKKAAGKFLLVYWGVSIVFLLADRLLPLPIVIPYSPVIYARDGSVLHAYLSRDRQWRFYAKLAEITPELKKAIIYKEDRHFYYHPGVNAIAVVRAIANNLFRHKRTSGASTITMQVARLLDPAPRTYLNKCIEMFRSLQLELHYSKNEILQLYLNLVPYGSNIQGVKAASLLYFNKTPDQLSLAEITALSIIPNRPCTLVMGRDNDRIVQERNRWLQRFAHSGLFPAPEIRDALREPLTARRRRSPAGVTQLANRIRREQPGVPEIKTTIDAAMQRDAEGITASYMNQLKLHNIHNASVLVVDNKTRQVLCYIGSSDFGDQEYAGQVDGIRALRSPGSTLKPLLYGLAFDKGAITPRSVIADVPISISGYSPENYDRIFRGNVTAEYALSNSLNIPAVKLLDKQGVGQFVSLLCRSGFNSIYNSKKKIGLSLILGGCGVRLEELTLLFAAFANDGIYQPPIYLAPTGKKALNGQCVKLLSPSAVFMVTKILSELHRPDLPNAYDEARGIPRIAWKTGTSYGRRDAWSVGYNRRYTIGVWVGNFSGAGVPELSGANTATPLLFRLFNAVDHDAANDWVEPPKEIAFRFVCAETGKVPSDFCHNQVMDYYIPGVSSNEACDHLKNVWLSADEKYGYCTACLPPEGYKTRLLPNISAELAAFYEDNHIPYTHLPPHYPGCTRVFKGSNPVITSLTNGITYLVENKAEQKLALTCTTANDVHTVYWYINDHFYTAAKANERKFFSAQAPVIKVSCTDDKGRNTNIQIHIRFI